MPSRSPPSRPDEGARAGTQAGPFAVARLPRTRQTPFQVRPDAAERAELAAALDLIGLRKLRLDGALHPIDGDGWELRAELGATVVQPCGVTLEPVTTRIDETVLRRYLPGWQDPAVETGADAEVEMPEDTDTEALGPVIDPAAVMAEALALAVPAFPRAPGASLGPEGGAAVPPGASNGTGQRPFAVLAGLRDRMAGKPDDPPPDKDGGPKQG